MGTEIGLSKNSLAQKYLPYNSNHPESKTVPRKLNYLEMYKDDMAEFKLSTPHPLSFSSSSKPKKNETGTRAMVEILTTKDFTLRYSGSCS